MRRPVRFMKSLDERFPVRIELGSMVVKTNVPERRLSLHETDPGKHEAIDGRVYAMEVICKVPSNPGDYRVGFDETVLSIVDALDGIVSVCGDRRESVFVFTFSFRETDDLLMFKGAYAAAEG